MPYTMDTISRLVPNLGDDGKKAFILRVMILVKDPIIAFINVSDASASIADDAAAVIRKRITYITPMMINLVFSELPFGFIWHLLVYLFFFYG